MVDRIGPLRCPLRNLLATDVSSRVADQSRGAHDPPSEEARMSYISSDPCRFWLRASVGGPPCAYGSKVPGRTKAGKLFVRNANASGVREWQDAMRKAMQQCLDDLMLDPVVLPFRQGKAVRFTVVAYLARPKSHFRKDGSLTKAGIGALPTRKPDGDKLQRIAADCGTGIWYFDDAQITQWGCEKRWSDGFERTEVEASDAS
jgi:Holliday junction resolvase RusA-like endonuclease